MKLVVDRDLCEANGICVRVAPEAFELGDDDVLHLRVVEPADAAQQERLEAAIRSCPRTALSWET
ncbi:MAG: ferredoxin [Myxococcales bacterium]|nr:ferredoxin [Myxococcales bacterium]